MSLHHLRRRVDALKRQLAIPLAVVRLRPLADEFCHQWAIALDQDKEPPPSTSMDALNSGDTKSKTFANRVVEAGYRLSTFSALQHYTRSCRERRILPQPNEILRNLLPKAAVLGLIPNSPHLPESVYSDP